MSLLESANRSRRFGSRFGPAKRVRRIRSRFFDPRSNVSTENSPIFVRLIYDQVRENSVQKQSVRKPFSQNSLLLSFSVVGEFCPVRPLGRVFATSRRGQNVRTKSISRTNIRGTNKSVHYVRKNSTLDVLSTFKNDNIILLQFTGYRRQAWSIRKRIDRRSKQPSRSSAPYINKLLAATGVFLYGNTRRICMYENRSNIVTGRIQRRKYGCIRSLGAFLHFQNIVNFRAGLVNIYV